MESRNEDGDREREEEGKEKEESGRGLGAQKEHERKWRTGDDKEGWNAKEQKCPILLSLL